MENESQTADFGGYESYRAMRAAETLRRSRTKHGLGVRSHPLHETWELCRSLLRHSPWAVTSEAWADSVTFAKEIGETIGPRPSKAHVLKPLVPEYGLTYGNACWVIAHRITTRRRLFADLKGTKRATTDAPQAEPGVMPQG